jgi:hypothetical protein
MKRDMISSSDEKVTKGGWASAHDINNWTRRTTGAHKPGFTSLGERADQEYVGALERESGQKYFLGRFRNLLCTQNGLLVGKPEEGN